MAVSHINALTMLIAGIVSKNSFANAMSAASVTGNTFHFHPSSICITSRDSAAVQVCGFLPALEFFHVLHHLLGL
jgi:hypothetical protein